MSALLRLLFAAGLATATLASAAETGRPPATPEARDGQRTYEFKLPAQAATSALLAFSKQTNIEVLFSFNALRHVQTKELKGRFEPGEALKRLLEGTGYTATPNGPAKFFVAPDTRKTGSIKGRVLAPDGAPATGARVLLVATTQTALTNAAGDFEFPAVEAGRYTLGVTADGFQSLQLAGLEVEPERALTIAPCTLRRADDPARLAPYFVQDHATRRDPFDRSEAQHGPRTAGSNLDLARTENDALPFNIYNRDQIARSGVVNLNEFLQRELLDSVSGVNPPDQDGTAPAFMAGSTNLNLRGFGTDQTIILVNGRRLPETLVNNGTQGQPQTPDVNFIPLSLVQQVEVLPISASALYSGNAVGGIINIVLRPGVDSEASEVSLTYTNALASYDAPQSSVSLLHSRSLLGGRLRVRFNASMTKTTPPTEHELGYRRRNDVTTLSEWKSLYRATPNIRSLVLLPNGDPADTGDNTRAPPPLPPLFGPGTATVTSVAPGADGNGGLAAFRGREGVRNFTFFDSPGGLASSLDSVDYPYGREQRRTAYFASVVYDVTPWLQLGFDGTYTRSVLHRGYDVISNDLRLDAESPFNPFHQTANVSLNEMAPQLGENYSEARLEFGSGVLSALLKLPSNWRVLLDGQIGRNVAKYRGLAGADYARWQKLVDDGIYNPLRDTQVFGPPQAFYDQVLVYRGGLNRFVTLGDYSTLDAALRVTNHELRLPTGPGTINVGVDYRRNELARHNDERHYADGTLAEDPVRFQGRALGRYSVFGEAQAPLVPTAWLPRWLLSADADAAVRYIASSQTKESNVAPTFALKLQLPAGFALRGSVSTSSRFPSPQMSRLVSSGATSGRVVGVDKQPAYDPVQKQKYNVQQDEFLDPTLRPEDAVTETAGLLFHRRVGDHRLRASVDFVETRKVNELIALDVQTIINLERLFPDRVIRRTTPGPDGRTGDVMTVITGTINSAWRRSHNWNASLDYAWTNFLGGTFEAYARLLYFTRYDYLLLKGAPVVDELAHPEAASNLLRYRVKFGTSWSNQNFGCGLDGHYFHSRVLPEAEWEPQGSDRIRPYWQCDAFVQGNIGRWIKWLPSSMRAQVRVNNVFATPYPRYETAGTGAGVQVYGDWRGQTYSLSLTTSF